jgi:putative ABC transport system permease protein
MTEYFVLAFRNLGRKKIRTVLTVLGIAVGVASVILIGSMGQSGKIAVSQQLENLGISGLAIRPQTNFNSSYVSSLGEKDVDACSAVPGVESAMPVIMHTGVSQLHGSIQNVLVWGVGKDAESIISLKLLYGRMFSKADIKSSAKVCLVDDVFASRNYKRANITGMSFEVSLGGGYEKLKVIGVVKSGSSLLYNLVGDYIPSFIYIPYSSAQELRGFEGFDQIAVKVYSNHDVGRAGERIVKVLNRLHSVSDGYVADNIFAQKERLSGLLEIVTLILSAVGGISLIVAGLGIMTLMMVSVNERTKEIGIKKAIGAKKRMILLEFIFEAVFISLLGSVLGIVAGAGLSAVAAAILGLVFAVNIKSVLTCVAFAAFIGILFGVYPAMKAANLKPVDALRQE